MENISTKKEPDNPELLLSLLHPLVKQWFTSKFDAFSLPQLLAILDIHSRKNILVSAPTGTGKTLTGFLAILNELVDSAQKGILKDQTYAVYVSPLKALNYDLSMNLIKPLEEINKLAGKDLGIRVGVRTGDTTPKERRDMIKNPPHILITTPESLAILLNVPSVQLNSIQWVIIDEIHALAENKRGVHLSLSIERLQHRSPGLTRVGLSATVAPLEEVAHFLVGQRDCVIAKADMHKQLDLEVICPVDDLVETTHTKLQNNTLETIHELIQSHGTTLVFTNTRAGTERLVHQLEAKKEYHGDTRLIEAHHGSLSKEHRQETEQKLREGKLRCVVCSTSLELGIDIGAIDLVIIYGSPKGTARLLQRIGRAGHSLNTVSKGRVIVQNREDLLECAIMVNEAKKGHIDRIHIPELANDVLVQHVLGMAIEQEWEVNHAHELIKQSYCYRNLSQDDFIKILHYLSTNELELQHIYAKIWFDGKYFRRKGKLTKVIHLTNLGTIIDQGGITVKSSGYAIGRLDESFLEVLRPGDTFVLAGNTYRFIRAKGMVADVAPASGKPTVPQWYSSQLPLSFDVAKKIISFISDLLQSIDDKEKSLDWIQKELDVNDIVAQNIYDYCYPQSQISIFPTTYSLPIEYVRHEDKWYGLVLATYGRRVNEALCRAIAHSVSRLHKLTPEYSINDHGFYISTSKRVDIRKAITHLTTFNLREVLLTCIEDTELLKRRFRHCAMRSFMILRSYKGRTKTTGQQHMSSHFLFHNLKRYDSEFIILQEARREVIEDVMDVDNAQTILKDIASHKLKLQEKELELPSPFGFSLMVQHYTDILTPENKQSFLRNMHRMVLAKLSLTQKVDVKPVDYAHLWDEVDSQSRKQKEKKQLSLFEEFSKAALRVGVDDKIRFDIGQAIENESYEISLRTQVWVDQFFVGSIPKVWPDDVVKFLQTLR